MLIVAAIPAALPLFAGCGRVLPVTGGQLFSVPLSIDGRPVGSAFVDTGGGYELILRDTFGLPIVETIEVLAFGGYEKVGRTEGFDYEVAGIPQQASSALVGLSVCDCNGVGFFFLRKTGKVMRLDFPRQAVGFFDALPAGGIVLPFEPPPPMLEDFDSAFVTVLVEVDGEQRGMIALLDTGTARSVMRRGQIGTPRRFAPDRQEVLISQEKLGTVSATVTLFDTAGLPDLIIGNDIMAAWGREWFFRFAPRGGTVSVFPQGGSAFDTTNDPDGPAAR